MCVRASVHWEKFCNIKDTFKSVPSFFPRGAPIMPKDASLSDRSKYVFFSVR